MKSGKSAKTETIAGIDIGSNSIKIVIAELKKLGKIKILESVSRTVSLGRDTFTDGKVSYETMSQTYDVLNNFKRLMKDYGIGTFRTVATSAVREAINRDYIVDGIRHITGLSVDVLSNAQERQLIHKCIKEQLEDFDKMKKKGMLVIFIGSGNVQISVYVKGELVISENIRLGSLRIHEILSDYEVKKIYFAKMLEEYIESSIDRFNYQDIVRKMDNFVVVCPEIGMVNNLHFLDNDNVGYIEVPQFEQILQEMEAGIYPTSEKKALADKADTILPSLLIINKFCEMTRATGIHFPNANLSKAVIYDIADRISGGKKDKDNAKEIITSVKALGRKYRFDEKHSGAVEKLSLQMFDKLSKMHGLGSRERQQLQIAALLHDTGKFINPNKHYEHSYNIIRAGSIIGLSDNDIHIIANVAKYHSEITPEYEHTTYKVLDIKSRVTVAKLTAILRMADALDISRKQKVTSIDTHIEGKKLIIKVSTINDLSLEQWRFGMKSTFFGEVFGFTPVLKVHNN